MKKTKKYPPVASIAHSAISKTRDRDIPISPDHFEFFPQVSGINILF